MRILLLLALAIAGCTNPRSAYLNTTDPYDADIRRMVLQLERRQEEPKLDWLKVAKQVHADIERLRWAHKTFSQGPAGSEPMRQAAQDLILKLVSPLELTFSTAGKTAAAALTPGEKALLEPQIKAAKEALTIYHAERKKFSDG